MSRIHRTTIRFAFCIALGLAACGPENVPIEVPSPSEDVLLWTLDAHGDTFTYWLRGNNIDGKLLAKREGVVLSLPNGLFEIQSREASQPTCDCSAQPPEDAGAESCPAVVASGASGHVLVAVRLTDGEEIPMTAAPKAEDSSGPLYEALEFGSAVTASVGPYVFVRTDIRTYACGAAHDDWSSEFQVFDLESGEMVDLLSEEERARILSREQKAAFALFEGDTLVDAERPEDLELTMITPVLLPGAGLSLRYQFTARSSFAASDGTWGAYTRSVDVPAAEMPAAMAPFQRTPVAIKRFIWPGEGLVVGGYSLVVATEEQLLALARLFSAAP
jgi:hypothetical protein